LSILFIKKVKKFFKKGGKVGKCGLLSKSEKKNKTSRFYIKTDETIDYKNEK
jgi:hypothetical protein